jgi:zinc protease
MNCRTLLALAALAASAPAQVFPYQATISDLKNELRTIVVPTGFPDVVSVHIVVATGSRNEIEEGKSGFAHFFEHMMFRGTKYYTSAQQAALFKAAGADRNAYTTDDYTNYHTTFAKEDLEIVLMLEADRFRNLLYSPEAFRTESMAVYGEYNKNSSDPTEKLFEVMRDTAFTTHTYKHTTMGFLRDIRAMPRQFDYSREFFARWYRPEYVTVVVVGDVEVERTNALVRKYFGDWQRGGYAVEIPAEPKQAAPLTCHVPWPSPTEPWVAVAFKGPAFSTSAPDSAALDLIQALAFSPSSELYRKLFVRERKVSLLRPSFERHKDPYLLGVLARVKDSADVAYVTRAIQDEFDRLREKPVDAGLLERVKKNLRYAFAARLDSSEAIAEELAGWIALARTPAVIDELFAAYEKITPTDLQAVAQRWFVESGRTIATLAHGELPKHASDASAPLQGGLVALPSPSPLVSVRLLFAHGSAADPSDKPGRAHLTAQMLARGSTTKRDYERIVDDLFPMAARVELQVDKEMTVFSGTVHRDNLAAFADLLVEMLAEPGWKEADLARIKSSTESFLDSDIRRANDEELGKEVLYGEIYAGHPYGHHAAGTLAAVRAMTVDDARAGHAALRAAELTVGVAGGCPEGFAQAFAARLRTALGNAASANAGALPAPPPIERNRLTIVRKQTRATGIHLGFPIEVTRAHPDWVALWLVRSYFGEHRSENSYLYQKLREIRGINYGDYAYIEYFPRGMFQFHPDPNLARRSQIFQIWIRPVPPEKALFTLKAAHWELERLVRDGLSEKDFEATRAFLRKFVSLLVKTDDRRLGYALDSRFYGIGDFAKTVKDKLAALTLDEVNRVLRAHLRADRLQIVVVTEDAAGFADALLSGAPGEIAYESPPPQAILDEDEEIKRHRIALRASDVKVVPVEEVFAR